MKHIVEQFFEALGGQDISSVDNTGFWEVVTSSHLKNLNDFYLTKMYVTPYINEENADRRGYEIEIHTGGWTIELIFTRSFSSNICKKIFLDCSIITPDDYVKCSEVIDLNDKKLNKQVIFDVGKYLKFSLDYTTPEYNMIYKHYLNKTARRSGVPLINHINEGLLILNHINSDSYTKMAYSVHPLFQNDDELELTISNKLNEIFHKNTILLALEYRNIANQYLSYRQISSIKDIKLSPLTQVNNMLIADKIQNYSDFLLYHKDKHERSGELEQYFNNWIDRLNCREVLEWFLNYKGTKI